MFFVLSFDISFLKLAIFLLYLPLAIVPFAFMPVPSFLPFLQQSAENTITFKLVPNENRPVLRESRIRLRGLFDYDPMEDKYIPCKEAGLPFRKGDIIHIVSQDDPYW